MNRAWPSRAAPARWLPAPGGLIALGLGLALGATGFVAVSGSGEPVRAAAAATAVPPPHAVNPERLPGRPEPAEAALVRALDAMEWAVEEGDAAGFVRSAGATPWATTTWRNLAALGVDDVRLRLVQTRPGRVPGVVAASVDVAWTPGTGGLGYADAVTVPREVTFDVRAGSVTRRTGGVEVLGAGAASDRWVPVWLSGGLSVASLPRGAVVSIGPGDSALHTDRLTRRAITEVHGVLPDASTPGRVVVVAPSTVRQAAQLLGRRAADLRSVAAVTSTVDGSRRSNAPVHVVLNPAVLERLAPAAAQLVVTHEAVHAATGAATERIRWWVAEGFADWVALRDSSVRPDVAAAQVLSSVRRTGLPQSLPGPAGAGVAAGAVSYEAAWTLFRLLARRFGDSAVTAFYDDVLAGRQVCAALRAHTGLDIPALTRAWRIELRRLARA